MAKESPALLISRVNLTIGLCVGMLAVGLAVIPLLVTGSSEVAAHAAAAAITEKDRFEQRFHAEAAPPAVDCTRQTWPYIDPACLRDGPKRKVRFVAP
jgi:hypothetical protein